jgi:large subunit ribosomal protein L9
MVGKNATFCYNQPPLSVVPFAQRKSLARKGLNEMKVLLIKDVYKLGRAGDVKKVADGYGRNFLLMHGMAVLATPGAMTTAEKIRKQGEVKRAAQNSELKDLADHINGITLTFSAKAGETGKLYGSITTQDIAKAIQDQTRYEVKRQQIDMQPIREAGEFKAHVRLTMDLMPEIKIIVHREGEVAETEAEAAQQAEEKPKRAPRGRKKAEEMKPAEAEAKE